MLERWFEGLLYASRWLRALNYFGMGFALFALTLKFFHEWADLLPLLGIAQEELVLFTLGQSSFAFVGRLDVTVMLSGHEKAGARVKFDDGAGTVGELGRLDRRSLKNEDSASIVAIPSVRLLKRFMEAKHIANDKNRQPIVHHLTSILSALIMTCMDRLQGEVGRSTDYPADLLGY